MFTVFFRRSGHVLTILPRRQSFAYCLSHDPFRILLLRHIIKSQVVLNVVGSFFELHLALGLDDGFST